MSQQTSKFSPKRPLAVALTNNGKLVGYLRLARQTPAVVLPVFVDADEDDNALFLYQRVNEAGVVSEFVADPDLSLEHLVLDETFDAPPIVSVGESPLHAYQINKHSFLAGRREKFRSSLKEFLQAGKLASWPFAALEVARFVGDTVSETSYAERCADLLMERSPKLASSWLAGSVLSAGAHEAANNAILTRNVSSIAKGSEEIGHQLENVAVEDVEYTANDDEALGRPGGLEWLKNANPNHESWARVWREIWSSAKPFPLTREEHAARGMQWLAQVDPNHGGWASVWYRIWAEKDPSARENIFREGFDWLAKTGPTHFRWPFVWQTLWDSTEITPRRQELASLADVWLSFPDHTISEWANVWLRMWDFHSSENDVREVLRSEAYNWLSKTDSNRKQWSIIWNVLFSDQWTDEVSRSLLIQSGLSWLKSKRPSIKAWKLVWAGLWRISEKSEIRDQLLDFAMQWLRDASYHRADWADVWCLVWDSVKVENIRAELQQLAEQWLTNVRPTHHGWTSVWLILWDLFRNDRASKNRLFTLGTLWLLKVPSDEPQRATLENEIAAFRSTAAQV